MLVACSGGADSAALVLALADRRPAVAHVLHDLRPRAQAEADRDATRALAERFGLRFVEAEVCVAGLPGNLEALARRARYEALARLAREVGVGHVLTGHHADDQLETLLLRLCRGAGVNGLRGIAPRRMFEGIQIIRPMLGLRRAECEAFCARCGFAWRHDQTNDDLSFTRAAIRHRVLPVLTQIDPRALGNSERVAEHMRQAARHLRRQARAVIETAQASESCLRWNRAALSDVDDWVLGEALRLASARLGGARGADRRGSRPVLACIRSIRRPSGEVRMIEWGRLRVVITRDEVRMEGGGDVE
ncbi:MAG: hypothetical protein Kow0022_16790 [Phycisphaerales bacterium]